MTDSHLFEWACILVFVVGVLLSAIRLRDWWLKRKYDKVMYESLEDYPKVKFSLRDDK